MINQVINIVREASKLMTSDITIEQKGNDSNFVTSADVNEYSGLLYTTCPEFGNHHSGVWVPLIPA